MSHPIPSHDYSEQTRGESNKKYKSRKHHAISKVLNKMKGRVVTGDWDGEPISRPKNFEERNRNKHA